AGQAAAHFARHVFDGTGTPVALQLNATDADGDALAFTATGLPPGLTLNAATGLISGTLSDASIGNYAVRATFTDQYVASEGTFTWRITGPNVPLTLTPVPNQTNADNLVTVALQLSAVDRNGDTVTFGATGLPRSLTIDPATGRISGTLTPSDPGVY